MSVPVIEAVEPVVDGGRFPAKATVGDSVAVRADVFAHGHELVRAFVRYRPSGARRWTLVPMVPLGNDRFEAEVVPEQIGLLEVEVLGEVDRLAGWRRDAARRAQVRFEPTDPAAGAALVQQAASKIPALRPVATALRKAKDAAGIEAALEALSEHDEEIASRPPDGDPVIFAQELAVQRELAACSAWYECFPRSTSPDPSRPGTLKDLEAHLSYVADLGFDVCYLPPVHPIGTTARKGPNNSSEAVPGDVGSPWAIGSPAGGHDAIAPELGTIKDFDKVVARARRLGLEIALDLAFQASPDHPWVHDHPEWFAHRSDGSIACAENPPKRYEDVYPLDFDTADGEGLYAALLGVVRFWMSHGVRVFRVDNPHTKPFAFWEWLIGEVHALDPGVIFLAEAFTRPKVMHRLAKLGFDQSYTYFTWRDNKWELADYLEELAHGPGSTYFRGNLWPNTPDILARSLQHGGRPAFVARLVLAACGSSNYGIYGPMFELLVDAPVAPGSEEYLNSEKYEVHHHDLSRTPLEEVLRRVNTARRLHPALRRNDSLRFHPVANDFLLCWSKHDDQTGDTVLCLVNLDPDWPQSGFVELDLAALGIKEGSFVVRDLLDDSTYVWNGSRNFVLLDPARNNAHVLVVERSLEAMT
ncbi:MAG: alpha amylase catalytic region [Acidimicrobiaceae bacterium]|nr:alpha amylase catalytic region [Acidimicrobiaceae bacterium]